MPLNSYVFNIARIHVYDSHGNYTGENESGGLDFQIDGGFYSPSKSLTNETPGKVNSPNRMLNIRKISFSENHKVNFLYTTVSDYWKYFFRTEEKSILASSRKNFIRKRNKVIVEK